jgi:membrane protease YdiL (CAAX protease family)
MALALLSGFAEETFFRGGMQGAWGWLPATLLFALAHPGPERGYGVWTVFVGVAGLGLAGLVEWRGNLLPAMVAHAVINGVNLSRLARRAAARGAAAPPGDTD